MFFGSWWALQAFAEALNAGLGAAIERRGTVKNILGRIGMARALRTEVSTKHHQIQPPCLRPPWRSAVTMVWRWQQRFIEEGSDGLLRDKTRKPGKPPIPAEMVSRVVALTCGEPPPGATHWTGRAMAKAVGVSLRSVQRIWQAHQLQPHRVRSFKRSRDPQFAEKMTGIVGLYLDPPAHAVVLSIDEKSQIQALDRTQPGLPLKPGRCGTMTHDYKRHGTTCSRL